MPIVDISSIELLCHLVVAGVYLADLLDEFYRQLPLPASPCFSKRLIEVFDPRWGHSLVH